MGLRLLAVIASVVCAACGTQRSIDAAGAQAASTDAGRYAHLRADGGCYDTSQVTSLTLIDVFADSQSCTQDSDCEIRPLGVTCVPSGCAIGVAKNSCGSWKPRHTELERTLCFDLAPTCTVVRIGCATPAPTRVYCDKGFCALTRQLDGGVPGCPTGGCESLRCP